MRPLRVFDRIIVYDNVDSNDFILNEFILLIFSQTGIVEMTWVISDYVAAQGSSELSVLKGQQVEVIDTNCLGAPDYCLVRLTNGPTNNNVSTTSLSSSSAQEQIIQEGLVPSSILKPPPTQSTKSRRAGEGEEGEFA